MRSSSVAALAMAIGLALGLGTSFTPGAEAQYPPPTGSVVLSAGDTTPDLGSNVTIVATVVDEAGNAVAGVNCTFAIAQQPGDDASVAAGPFATDDAGRVTTELNSGSTEGAIVVTSICEELTAQVTVVAGEVAPPPASLPDTGTGMDDADGMGWSFGAVVIVGAVFGLIVVSLVRRRVRA